MISFREKLVTDGRTDGRTDERQQIYRTNLPKVGGSKKEIKGHFWATEYSFMLPQIELIGYGYCFHYSWKKNT